MQQQEYREVSLPIARGSRKVGPVRPALFLVAMAGVLLLRGLLARWELRLPQGSGWALLCGCGRLFLHMAYYALGAMLTISLAALGRGSRLARALCLTVGGLLLLSVAPLEGAALLGRLPDRAALLWLHRAVSRHPDLLLMPCALLFSQWGSGE